MILWSNLNDRVRDFPLVESVEVENNVTICKDDLFDHPPQCNIRKSICSAWGWASTNIWQPSVNHANARVLFNSPEWHPENHTSLTSVSNTSVPGLVVY